MRFAPPSKTMKAVFAGGLAVSACFGFEHPVLYEGPDAAAAAGASHAGSGGLGPSSGGTAAGAAGQPDDALAITTIELPDAVFGQKYEFTLQASGLSGGGQSWAVSAGKLPSGIALAADGTLHGTACEAASFEFELTLSDSGASAKRSLEFEVRREKPWLVYVAGPGADTTSALYAARLTSSLPLSTKVSPEAQPDARIHKYAFSPDGSWLALTTDATVDERMDLYLVDMRGDSPLQKPKVEIPIGGSVEDFAWSPRSDRIAIALAVDQGEPRVFWTALSGETAFVAQSLVGETEAAAPVSDARGMGWVSSERLVYPGSDVSYEAQSTAIGFAHPEMLPFFAALSRSWPEVDSALLSMPFGACDGTWYLADFRTGEWRSFDGLLEVSPNLDRVAYWADSGYALYSAWAFDAPLAQVPTGGGPCPAAAWSHDGRFFATTVAGDRLGVTKIGGSDPTPLSGQYSTAIVPAFSNDDEWLAFAAGFELSIAHRGDDGSFDPARPVSSPPDADGGVEVAETTFRFAPDSRMIAYGHSSVWPVTSRVYVAHLDASQQNLEITDVSSDMEPWTRLEDLGWSADSMTLAYRLSGPAVGWQGLSVVERCPGLPSPHVEPVTLNSSYSSSQSFAFQP